MSFGCLIIQVGVEVEIRFGVTLHIGLIGSEFRLISPLRGYHYGKREFGFVTGMYHKAVSYPVYLQRDSHLKIKRFFIVGHNGKLIDDITA
ncbi:hypothetical protein SDC9_170578 [bioreactor metagenome]|uniref:Uncharacterized protein n=1 Tax=bioreactor metagenome TaxID=1076179 RepID=A0A645GAX7_9ZZZZ